MDLDAVKERLEAAIEQQLLEFDRETELHFVWLDELLPTITSDIQKRSQLSQAHQYKSVSDTPTSFIRRFA
jgi:hypothetical protein